MADRAIRAAQLADQIRDYVALWLHEDFPGEIVTVHTVTMKPNQRDATVWVSCFSENSQLILTQRASALSGRYQHRLRRVMTRRALPNIHLEVTGAQEVGVTELLLK